MIPAAPAISVLILVLGSGQLSSPSEGSAQQANELARKILMNEVRAETQDQSHWMFRLETEKGQAKEVYEVVETKDGDLKRRVSLNGRPLTAKQEQDEDRRIQKLIHNPEALRKLVKDEDEDAARSERLLKMLPDAWTFSYGERHGDMLKLHFEPNPNFQPPSREARVLQALEGDMWVNSKQERLAQITGQLECEVRFGGGLLGHLNPGGQFEVQQTEVAPGHWALTLLDVDMKGKALFFKTISVQQKMYRSNFRRVSDDLTLAQAANMLREQAFIAQNAPTTRY